MKKFFAVLIWLFGTIVLLTSCGSNKNPSCELTLTSTETSVSYSLSFADLSKKQTSYKIEILNGETSVKNEVSTTDITAGQFSNLDLNTNYVVKVYVSNKAEYDVCLATKDIQTKKGTLTGVTFNDKSFVYDGQAKKIEVGSLPEGASVSYTGNDVTDAGEYTVTAVVKKDNYNDLTLQAKLTITLASPDFDLEDKTVVYDGEPHTIVADTQLELAYEYYSGETKLEAAPVQAGSYVVKAIYAGDKNHEKLEKTATLTIEKAASSITAEDIMIKFGETYEVSATCSVSGAELGVTYLKGETVLEAAPTQIGTYSIKITYAGNENYNGCSKTIGLIITNPDNQDVTISLENITSVYGQTYSVEPTADHGVTLADLVIKYYTTTGEEIAKPVNAGSYEIKISYAGSETSFLNPAQKTVTLTINKANYDLSGIEFKDLSVVYDGSEKELTYTGTLPAGVTFVGYTTNKGTNAGTYNAKASFLGADTANYNPIPDMSAVLTITKADPTKEEIDGLQKVFVNDYTPQMTVEVFKTRLEEKLLFFSDYTQVLQSGENKITVVYKKGDNYNDYALEITLKCNAQLTGFTATDGNRQIAGRPFDKENIVITYLYNDGTSKKVSVDFTTSTVNSTDSKFSVEVTLTNADLAEKTKTVEINPISAPQVMIYAVYGAGGNGGASYKNDFIILYNASSEDIDLTDWSLQYAAATSKTAISKTNIASLEGVIKSYGYYVVVAAAGSNEVPELPFKETANGVCSLTLGASNFQLYLSTTSTPITTDSYGQSSYVDMVGAGTAVKYEGTAAPAPGATTYIRRKALNDTDDNSADYELVSFKGTNDFDYLAEGHRVYNYAKSIIEAQNLDFNNLPETFNLPMSFEGTSISWKTENADNLSIAADGTVTVSKATECDGKLIGTIEGYALGFEFNVFISNKIRLESPTVSLNHFTLTWTAVDNASGYSVYVDGEVIESLASGVLEYDLYTNPKFSSIFANAKSYSITVVAITTDAQHYVDSLPSEAVDLNIADTSDLNNLVKGVTYTIKAVVTIKGAGTKNNIFVRDLFSNQGFLIYNYSGTEGDAFFSSIETGKVIYISGIYDEYNKSPQFKSIKGVTVTTETADTNAITETCELTKADLARPISLNDAVVVSKFANSLLKVSVGENEFNLYPHADYLGDVDTLKALLPGNTVNFSGAVGLYNDTVQVFLTGYTVTGHDLSDEYKLEISLQEIGLNQFYTCDASVTLPSSGKTYTDVALTYSESTGIHINANVLTFDTVTEDTIVTLLVTATLNGTPKQESITLTVKPQGSSEPTWSTKWSDLESGTYTVLLAGIKDDVTYLAKNTLTSGKFQTVDMSTVSATDYVNYQFTIIVNKEQKTVQIKTGNDKFLDYNSSTNFKEGTTEVNWAITSTSDGKNDYLLNNRAIICNSGANNKPFGAYATSNVGKADYPFLSFMILS